ncbi:MAG: SsrA-binding protein SmpB [Anaerolineae bacterium]|nr:SsrA-binding protein SmpB [Anaerolineae bacterium]
MAKKASKKKVVVSSDGRKVVATNRKARHDYELGDAYEAGVVLVGTEIKSIREGRVNLRDSYVEPRDGELWLINAHIAIYEPARENHDPRRPRKLLLHRREIERIAARIAERGYTVVPTLLYLKKGRVKVEIAMARGKRQYDKRATLQAEQSRRDIDRALKQRQRDY